MEKYLELDPMDLQEPFIRSIAKDWMLVTVQTPDGKTNPMTASWGGVGFIWNRPVFWCVLRPQRYTDTLAKQSDGISISFYKEEKRSALSFCGSHSGRDCDKEKEAGLQVICDGQFAYYEGARLVLMGKKLYMGRLGESGFLEKEILGQCYPMADYHYVYVCQIDRVLQEK